MVKFENLCIQHILNVSSDAIHFSFFFQMVENIVGKGQTLDYQRFLFFQQYFPKLFIFRSQKLVIG